VNLPVTEVPLKRAPGGEDVCIARARAVAERHAVKVLSLDVFDTLLWRVVPEPVDAFVLVGRALAERGALRVSPEAFGRLREAAERRARARSVEAGGGEEVSLGQIYAHLGAALSPGSDPEALADVETAVERTITFPDLAVVELAEYLRASRAVRVVLVSDTYFSAARLLRLLGREPFAGLHFDGVFTSSDHGCNKGSGLYDVVLDALGVTGTDVLHLGDHPDADVAAATKAGLHAVLLERRPDPLPAVLEREGVSRTSTVTRRRAPLVDGACDAGLTALRAKVLRRVHPATLAEPDRVAWRTGAAVFGPIFTGFAEWVLDRTEAEGAERVFCVMREGAFLVPLLEAARRQRGRGPEPCRIWLSRYVCTQAAIVDGSPDEIEMFLGRRQPPTVAAACVGLGLDPAALGRLAARAGDRLDDPALRRQFVEIVTASPAVRDAVLEHASTVRRRLVRHVVETAGEQAGTAVLVDLGWGATIQAGLDAALRAEDVELGTLGLYLLTNDAAVARVLDGLRAEGFLGSVGLPEPAVAWIMRSPEILEQVCMPATGSLRGFDEEGRPVTGPGDATSPQQAQRQAARDGVLAFQEERGRYRELVPAGHHDLHDRARPLLRRMLLRFVVDPTVEEARTFGGWAHDENWGSDEAEAVLRDEVAERLGYMTPVQLLELPMDRLYWPFGLAALHNPPLARAAAAVAFGELPAELFTAGTDTHATLYVDYGAGLLPRAQVPATPSSRGLAYLRRRLDAHPLRAVGIGFPPGPGLVRLDWMTLRFGLRGRSEPVVVDLRWPEDAERVRYHDAEVLSRNLVLGRHRAPRVSFECPDEWGLDAYNVEVEAGFAWLPSVADPPPAIDRAAIALALARRAVPRARKVVQLGRAVARRLVR
jgi:FMN phosphatase YigB (HAD superfamily)